MTWHKIFWTMLCQGSRHDGLHGLACILGCSWADTKMTLKHTTKQFPSILSYLIIERIMKNIEKLSWKWYIQNIFFICHECTKKTSKDILRVMLWPARDTKVCQHSMGQRKNLQPVWLAPNSRRRWGTPQVPNTYATVRQSFGSRNSS
jgi:hypothetical protein